MAETVRAVFDGEVLRPEQPVDLQPNTTYVLTIEREAGAEAVPGETARPKRETLRRALGLLAGDRPVPSDQEIERWLQERRAEKYG